MNVRLIKEHMKRIIQRHDPERDLSCVNVTWAEDLIATSIFAMVRKIQDLEQEIKELKGEQS